jgi:hypothetical protein
MILVFAFSDGDTAPQLNRQKYSRGDDINVIRAILSSTRVCIGCLSRVCERSFTFMWMNWWNSLNQKLMRLRA